MSAAQMSTLRFPQNTYYRGTYAQQQPQQQQQQQQQQRHDVRDDYERWYTEPIPSNRMSLSLRSGILSDVGWALDRLLRLFYNETYLLATIPGIIDSLFDWPEWYISEGYKFSKDENFLFSPPPDHSRKRRYALESLFVLRNAALYEPNAMDLLNHSHTLPLVLNGLNRLQHDRDEDSEFVLHIIDLYHVVAAKIVILPTTLPAYNPIQSLTKIISESSNRSMLIAALTALTITLSNPVNVSNLSVDSPALSASIKYLPLFADKPLVDACLNYLYAHISNMTMAKAFLLRPELPAVIRVLVTLLLEEQGKLEETVVHDISGAIHTVPSSTVATRDHALTKEEFEALLPIPEPQRCYDWMKAMFIAKPDGEVTQVDFWNLYKDVFTPHTEQYPVLVASDVIKNVNLVFPEAQAMVLPGPVQRFIVRGVDRRKDSVRIERFKCQWDRSECESSAFSSPGELFDHLLEHLTTIESPESPCLWSICSRNAMTKAGLRSHVLTHLSTQQPLQKPPSQSETITLPSTDARYPLENPTTRLPPPSHNTTITVKRPIMDPPSIALTALLCLRILFRTSFASADAAPRVDADHFGFPGVVEEQEEQDMGSYDEIGETEREGEWRGRRAFVSSQNLLENVRIRDEGFTAQQIAPYEDQHQFFTNLFNLEVKSEYLRAELTRLTKESCLGKNKHSRIASFTDIRKNHALETLSILLRCILVKSLSGWEVMEILGGGVGQSDDVFMAMISLISDLLKDVKAPLNIRHQALQVALICMCSLGQLSPGAYFLRHDMFPSIVTFIKSCDDERFVSEAALLLAILANFHKNDAAKLNPYLKPVASAVFLLPVFEFLRANPLFPIVLLETSSQNTEVTQRNPRLSYTILTLSSYILTHASSASSPRSLSYANLSLHILLALVENDGVMSVMNQPSTSAIPICRQRLPHLPAPQLKRSPICAILDCCVLWLRHNLHRRLEVYCYLICIQICYRIVWYLQNSRLRLEYEWKELWTALLGLLTFFTTKLDTLDTTGGVEQIVRETLVLLSLSLDQPDGYLPSPEALHEFIYELIRSASALESQDSLLKSLTVSRPDLRHEIWVQRSAKALKSILEIVNYYKQKVNEANARTAKAAMGVVAQEIEVNGLYTTEREAHIP
ncbi:hypothetical protein H0H93_004962 [Arthromyces matolae]|nr:hypothetical protein H0H93_004962 [Arthromyces matolae]